MSAAFYQDEVKFYVAVDCIILGFNNKELNVREIRGKRG